MFKINYTIAIFMAAIPFGQAMANGPANDQRTGSTAHSHREAPRASRSIVIGPSTKYVNVEAGEVIRFVVADKAFTWNFDRSVYRAPVNLQQTAPKGIFDHEVTAYVAPNPMYFGAP